MADAKAPDLAGLAAEIKRQTAELARQVQHALSDAAGAAQIELEKAGARFAADHPDLYTELRKTAKQLERTLKVAAEDLGFGERDAQPRRSKK